MDERKGVGVSIAAGAFMEDQGPELFRRKQEIVPCTVPVSENLFKEVKRHGM